MVSRIAAIVALVGLAACERGDSHQPRNVFGPDNREPVTSEEYPWSALGRLDSGCTGVLIGRRLVLTASHCVYDKEKDVIRPTLGYFRANFIDGNAGDKSWVDYVWFGTKNVNKERHKDWAVLRLQDPLGDDYHWLGLKTADIKSSLPYTVNLAGYSLDKKRGQTATAHRGCYVHEMKKKRLLHDCDSWRGISGAPLFKYFGSRAYIVGLAVSEYRKGAETSVHRPEFKEEYANVAISTKRFGGPVGKLLETVDAGQAAPELAGVYARKNPNSPGVKNAERDPQGRGDHERTGEGKEDEKGSERQHGEERQRDGRREDSGPSDGILAASVIKQRLPHIRAQREHLQITSEDMRFMARDFSRSRIASALSKLQKALGRLKQLEGQVSRSQTEVSWSQSVARQLAASSQAVQTLQRRVRKLHPEAMAHFVLNDMLTMVVPAQRKLVRLYTVRN